MLPIRDHEPSLRFPVVTIGLIAVNVWVFVQELLSPNLERFIETWALVPARVAPGDITTLTPFITSQFLHAGFAHIFFNMWYLWIFGDNIEGHFGRLRFLFFYLCAGVIAGLVQLFFLVGSSLPMLGASGAVAGVLGAYWVLFPRHRVDTLVPSFGFWSRATLPAGTVLVFWFLSQLFSGVGSLAIGSAATGGVAWWAHIGGFVFGLIVARLVRQYLRHAHPAHAHRAEHVDLWK